MAQESAYESSTPGIPFVPQVPQESYCHILMWHRDQVICFLVKTLFLFNISGKCAPHRTFDQKAWIRNNVQEQKIFTPLSTLLIFIFFKYHLFIQQLSSHPIDLWGVYTVKRICNLHLLIG